MVLDCLLDTGIPVYNLLITCGYMLWITCG